MDSAPQARWDLVETLPAVPDSVPTLRRSVTRFLAEAGATPAGIAAVELAVSEAVTNAVRHAYLDHPEAGQVSVTARIHDDTVELMVSDEGRGMLPRLDSPGLGLGMPLIAHSADSLELRQRASGGTEIHMSFPLRPR
jgi:serine/threonine-protein kinase RsbW